MVMTDPIADFLTRIRNANQAKHEVLEVPASNCLFLLLLLRSLYHVLTSKCNLQTTSKRRKTKWL